MTPFEFANYLSMSANTVQVGIGLQAVYTFFSNLSNNEKADPALVDAIAALPTNAPPDEVVAAMKPFLKMGGDVSIAAGDNGGGNVSIVGAHLIGGDGLHRGGNVNLKAGDGGPSGNGGDLNIGPGTAIKGGNAAG